MQCTWPSKHVDGERLRTMVDRGAVRGPAASVALVGPKAARNSALSGISFVLAVTAALVFAATYVGSRLTHEPLFGPVSWVAAILMVIALISTGVYILKAGRAASDYLAPRLGFRPRWPLGGYWSPATWSAAIERQKKWNARGKWPRLPM